MTQQHRSRDLKRDRRGNTLMIFGFALFPMLGMIGGALDISRAYLVKSRLQQACDAAVLGGRRSMRTADFNSDPYALPSAQRFFKLNFTPGKYGSYNTPGTQPFTASAGADMIVHGIANTTVPMVIMKLFGMNEIALTATCDAQLQLPNTDIMFVLDTTGSMAITNPGEPMSKIDTLRDAVTNFYNTLSAATTSASQVRYGFVPYSSTVNVGLLLKNDWMVDRADYQSRSFNEMTTGTSSGQATTTTTRVDNRTSGSKTPSDTYQSIENCVAPANTKKTTTTYGSTTTTTQPNGDVWTSRPVKTVTNGHEYTKSFVNNQCKITDTVYENYTEEWTEVTKPNPNAGQTAQTWTYFYNYGVRNIDVSVLKGGNGYMAAKSISVPNVNATPKTNTGSPETFAWKGCIEERQATTPIQQLIFGWGPDMDINYTPKYQDDDKWKWRPWLSNIIFARPYTSYDVDPPWKTGDTANVNHTTANYFRLSARPQDRAACPAPARKLAPITGPALSDYLKTLTPAGMTYHDIGFMWGLRLMSKDGLFASENQDPASGKINRNLIFMTDGNTETNRSDYDAFGLAALDRRRTDLNALPDATTPKNGTDLYVEQRLRWLCGTAKSPAMGITVWVIAFGTDMTPLLHDCATPGHDYTASNRAELNATFADIASKIAQLRVTK